MKAHPKTIQTLGNIVRSQVDLPGDVQAHLKKRCFNPACNGKHLTRFCPLLFETPEAGRFVPKEATAKAATRKRAAPGEGLQRNYHKYPAFEVKEKCSLDGSSCGPFDKETRRCFYCKRVKTLPSGGGEPPRRFGGIKKCDEGECVYFLDKYTYSDACFICERREKTH